MDRKNRMVFWSIILGTVLLFLIWMYFFSGHKITKDMIKGCAINEYNQAKSTLKEFNSQCLGECYGYAVDLVHSPRTAEDDLPNSQCESYRNGTMKHFIEIDKFGKIVRME